MQGEAEVLHDPGMPPADTERLLLDGPEVRLPPWPRGAQDAQTFASVHDSNSASRSCVWEARPKMAVLVGP